jgi:biotin carboxyl carrier protein
MEPKELKEFLKSLENTDIEELEIDDGSTSVYLKKNEAACSPAVAPVVSAKPAQEVQTVFPIKSPMVGTFYNSQSKNYPPFVIEGNHVVPGQKVGAIEAMKILKDVNSNVKGKITKILVTNGQAVEYGQDLFLVDTSAE